MPRIILNYPTSNRFKLVTNFSHELAHHRQRQIYEQKIHPNSFEYKASKLGFHINQMLTNIPETLDFPSLETCYTHNIIEVDARLFARDIGYAICHSTYSEIINNDGDEIIDD
jgi:hypothetical protein